MVGNVGRWSVVLDGGRWEVGGVVGTCEARLKLGPGERFLAGAGGAAFAPALPLRLRRLLAGRCDSADQYHRDY